MPETDPLQYALDTLDEARQQFEFYAEEHNKKAGAAVTPETLTVATRKAMTNERFAHRCQQAFLFLAAYRERAPHAKEDHRD